MNGFRRLEFFDSCCSPMFITETSVFKPPTFTFPQEMELDYALDLLNPTPIPSPFDTITDLIQIERTPSTSTYKRYQEKKMDTTHFSLKTLSDRVSFLEQKLLKPKKSDKSDKKEYHDRKYSWTAEIKAPEKDGVDKKYKWTAEIKGGKKEEKEYKYIAEYKGKGKDSPIDRKYIFKASSVPVKKLEKKKDKKAEPRTAVRVVEIEEEPVDDEGVVVLKQAFARRVGENGKGKKKELSPQDAAMLIQRSFKAYLIRRSQVLRALRELAVAKAKLKEIRALFNNFSYRRRIARDAEERQKFSEKIIVLLLTVDAIEGADLTVRAARRSIVDELEAMLDVVDPQPAGKLGSMKRRTFDMPDADIRKEIAAGVAEVVQMLDQDEKNGANTFELCL